MNTPASPSFGARALAQFRLLGLRSIPSLPASLLAPGEQVRGEDFSSYLAKLSTPRELMIMMTEMFSRIEQNPEGGLTGQVRAGWARA